MWDTNLVGTIRTVGCDDDCLQSGCPGHAFELKVHSVAGRGSLLKDGKQIASFDRNEAEALLEMLLEIKNS